MELLYKILTLIISIPLISLTLTFFLIILRIFAFKSINSPNYPPVRGTVLHLAFHFHRLQDYFTAVAAEQPTFRILLPTAQSYVYTAEPRNVEHILKESFGSYSKGRRTREILDDLLGDGIFAADGNAWRHQRKLASFEFSARALRDFSCSIFRRNASKLVRVVSEFAEADRVFDMQALLMSCTLDSISQVGLGVELKCLEGSSEEAARFMKAFDASNAFVFWRFLDPLWKLKRLLSIGSERNLRKQVKIVDDFVYKVITKKRTLLTRQAKNNWMKNGKEDILSRFLMESEMDPERMNEKYLRDIVLSFIFAGKDTTAGTLSWFFYMLCKHPLIQEKVAQEVRDIVVGCDLYGDNKNTCIHDFVEKINEEALEKMHYLHAALTETLRLYPAVPVDGRCAEVEDTLPNGFKIRKGDEVFYLSYAMGRMSCLWGDDATDFRPERWLNDGVFQPESPFKFVAFHAGPRICLGKDFAYRQMKIVSASLLYLFRFKLAHEVNSLTYKSMLTLHIDGELSIYALPRIS